MKLIGNVINLIKLVLSSKDKSINYNFNALLIDTPFEKEVDCDIKNLKWELCTALVCVQG